MGATGRNVWPSPKRLDWVLAPDPAGVFRPTLCTAAPAARRWNPGRCALPSMRPDLTSGTCSGRLASSKKDCWAGKCPVTFLETGAEVSTVSAGDHILGLGFGAFGPQMVTHEELVTAAPPGLSVSELATVPSAFVSAALSFEYSGLKAGERVLIHAGAGGVGLAAIQLVQAAGAEVFATASAPKQDYLRSLGVQAYIRQPHDCVRAGDPGRQRAANGVDVVLNSLTGRGFHRRQPVLPETGAAASSRWPGATS